MSGGDEYPGRDAEVEAPASADYQAAYTWTPIEVDVISATGANHVAPAGVPVEAVERLWTVWTTTPGCYVQHGSVQATAWATAANELRALLPTATTDGGESGE